MDKVLNRDVVTEICAGSGADKDKFHVQIRNTMTNVITTSCLCQSHAEAAMLAFGSWDFGHVVDLTA